MVQVFLLADTWSKFVDVENADELLEAEGMSWQRDALHDGDRPDDRIPADVPRDAPTYVPAVSA